MPKYSISVIWSDEDECFVATCPEFPGLSAFGETRVEAMKEARVALDLFEEQYKEDQNPLPSSRKLNQYSGQTRIRMPRWLHQNLAEQAEHEDTSLNQLMVSYLSASVTGDSVIQEYQTKMNEAVDYISKKVAESGLLSIQISENQVGDETYQDPTLRRIQQDNSNITSSSQEA
mgnify:CR=1 FL=1